MPKLTQAQQDAQGVINFMIGLPLAIGILETTVGALTIKGVGLFGELSPQARVLVSSQYFCIALFCFGVSGKIYCNTYGTPKLPFWNRKTTETTIEAARQQPSVY